MQDPIPSPPSSERLLDDLAAEPNLGTHPGQRGRSGRRDHPGLRLGRGDHPRGRHLLTPASTGAVVEEVDQAQYELEEGPCVDAVWGEDILLIEDMSTETRWPNWAPRALEHGVRSSLSVRLTDTKDFTAGLNLYSKAAHSFDEESLQLAHQYATHAAAALTVSHRFSTLRTALQTRHTIGMAQGILRHRHGLTTDEAFKVLVRVSRNNNVRLREVAVMVVKQNGLPPRFTEDPASNA